MNNYTFFGSSKFSVFCLEELKQLGLSPVLIVTTPDQPTGRGLKMTATPVKIWAEENKIPCIAPQKLDESFSTQLNLETSNLFLVASYGKIIPSKVLELPKHGTLNIHPSLLPKYRGPSPLQAQILNDEKEVGVSLMSIDEKVDHGPIIVQEKISIENWPVNFEELEKITALSGVKLFSDVLENWLNDKIIPIEQDHDQATFTKKIEKEDGLINLSDNSYMNFLKIQAYSTWPKTFFFIEKDNKKIRVIIKEARFIDGQLLIQKVLPEGKKEMNYADFVRGLKI